MYSDGSEEEQDSDGYVALLIILLATETKASPTAKVQPTTTKMSSNFRS